jgi:hypothetical protein
MDGGRRPEPDGQHQGNGKEDRHGQRQVDEAAFSRELLGPHANDAPVGDHDAGPGEREPDHHADPAQQPVLRPHRGLDEQGLHGHQHQPDRAERGVRMHTRIGGLRS